ncbi:hypothetical protein AF435_14680 [Listeria monocytogenes]|uniref:Uncharacterized protein n=1 Tax=Listeria monocytogenes TaxID=1639 RepID=A0AAN2WIX5_LISMN|nr:hypothetical protein [Listeria monocytogenes]EAC3367789.1 hypothetical protein [Listeria monocytogenes]EAC7086946.1 hypothetical protein [Listeria monocytogenes]EAC8542044.1 hypothetical protein [Listeria monocytogenes]EAC8548046.1 hypothetical protein [Listeria monocytogenes]
MDIFDEKTKVYELMSNILNEKKELTRQYDWLQERLNEIEEILKSSYTKTDEEKKKAVEIESQKYFESKKSLLNKSTLDYAKVSRQIAHILKNSDVPLNIQTIHRGLQKLGVEVSRVNLSNNILRRMISEKSSKVTRAARGFYQYG